MLGTLLFISIDSLQIWFPIIPSAISGFLGYYAVIGITAFAYIADISTSPESLTIRMVVLSVCIQFSMVIGNLLTGVASKSVNYVSKF